MEIEKNIAFSVGITFNNDDLNELYKLASQAVKSASERGGDLVVFNEYWKEFFFWWWI